MGCSPPGKRKGQGAKEKTLTKTACFEEAALRCTWCVLVVRTLYAYFQMILAFQSSHQVWVQRMINMLSHGTSLGGSKYGGDMIGDTI